MDTQRNSAVLADPSHPVQMMRIGDVAARTTLSESQINKMRKAKLLPQSTRIGVRACMWPDYRIDAWLFSCMQLRSSMRTLSDPVELPIWTPELEYEMIPLAPYGIEMVRRSVVLNRARVKKSFLYDELIPNRGFPWPVPISVGVRAWVLFEVEEWLRRVNERRRADDPGFAFLTARRERR